MNYVVIAKTDTHAIEWHPRRLCTLIRNLETGRSTELIGKLRRDAIVRRLRIQDADAVARLYLDSAK